MMTSKDGVNLARKIECEEDGLYFTRYFFKQRFSSKMLVSAHHHLIQQALDKTLNGEYSRLIINIPPGYTKTEQAVISYMARGLAINSQSRFLHLSYSAQLALLNSSTAREMVKSQAYQAMWPVKTKDDTDSKSLWWTTENGGVYATSAGGQVTGFRAGHMHHTPEVFTGALLIDDPVKPDDAKSDVKREEINERFNETIASRLAVESVPIVVIMQRIHHNDMSGYLLRGGSGENWHHLNLPAITNRDAEYPREYTHGIPIEHDLPDGWLWPFKHNDSHYSALSSHRRKWRAQYLQDPIKRDESIALWSEDTISKCRQNVSMDVGQTYVSIDPAVTANLDSDEHGIVVGTKIKPDLFRIDGDYTCKGSPKTWADRAIMAYDKHEADAIVIETNQGGDMCESTLRNAGFTGRVIRVHASKGKISRAEPIAALYEQGFVKHKAGLTALEDEMMDLDPLTGKVNGRSPNRVDALVWLLTELSGIAKTPMLL